VVFGLIHGETVHFEGGFLRSSANQFVHEHQSIVPGRGRDPWAAHSGNS
jgi:hypothetical protein